MSCFFLAEYDGCEIRLFNNSLNTSTIIDEAVKKYINVYNSRSLGLSKSLRGYSYFFIAYNPLTEVCSSKEPQYSFYQDIFCCNGLAKCLDDDCLSLLLEISLRQSLYQNKEELLREIKPFYGGRAEKVVSLIDNEGPLTNELQCINGSFRNIINGENNKDTELFKLFNRPLLPIVHLTIFDIFNQEECPGVINPTPAVRMYMASESKRYKAIIDSSIWNYYAPIQLKEDRSYDFNSLDKAVESIVSTTRFAIGNNSMDNIYKLSVAGEYANFHARLVKESYLTRLGGGHGERVSPYLFHSETEMEGLLNTEYRLADLENYRWRILLVDDRVENSFLRRSNGQISQMSKDIIVGNRIEEIFIKHKSSKFSNIYIDIVPSLSIAVDKLKKNKYEIILLDYLLGEPSLKGNCKQEREYSYELLGIINEDWKRHKTDKKFEFKYGPHGRLYFMFISAFTTAVNERLRAEGLHKSEKYWHIADGACPTNTPHLFMYNLLHLMNKRLEDSGILKLSVKAIGDKLEEIFAGTAVRNKANDQFDEVLSLLYHYKNLLEDVEEPDCSDVANMKGSALATSFIHNNPNLGGLLEHVTQLVYLVAFGTVRQWPEMWSEFHYIRTIMTAEGEKGHTCLEKIEKYILKLKTNGL